MELSSSFVITGGPGSGKTRLISALAAQGIRHMPEAGRAIIREQLAIGGSALPWLDPLAFAALMLRHELRSYRQARGLVDPILFDRGIPDVVGYLRVTGMRIPGHLAWAARRCRYNRLVFIAPPWRAIFAQDAERRQSFDEAEATYRAMVEVYADLGYELMPLPLVSVADRVEFVRATVRARIEATGVAL